VRANDRGVSGKRPSANEEIIELSERAALGDYILVFARNLAHSLSMTKSSKSRPSKVSRSAANAPKVGARKTSKVASAKTSKVVSRKTSKVASHKTSKVLGTTSDGVRILKPKSRATHFTVPQLKAAISRVRAARASG